MYSVRHASMRRRASESEANHVVFRHSSRKLPSKHSQNAFFCIGLPGWMCCTSIRCRGCPLHEVEAREFRTVVADERLRCVVRLHRLLERFDHARRRQRRAHAKHDALAREVIDHREDPKASAVPKLVMHEVHARALMRSGWRRRRSAHHDLEPLAATPSDHQPFFPVNAAQTAHPGSMAVAQHDLLHASVTVPRMRVRNLANRLSKTLRLLTTTAVALRRTHAAPSPAPAKSTGIPAATAM